MSEVPGMCEGSVTGNGDSSGLLCMDPGTCNGRGALQTGLRKDMDWIMTPTITLSKSDRPLDSDRAFCANAATMAICRNVPQVQGPLSVLTFPLSSHIQGV